MEMCFLLIFFPAIICLLACRRAPPRTPRSSRPPPTPGGGWRRTCRGSGRKRTMLSRKVKKGWRMLTVRNLIFSVSEGFTFLHVAKTYLGPKLVYLRTTACFLEGPFHRILISQGLPTGRFLAVKALKSSWKLASELSPWPSERARSATQMPLR